MHIKDILKLICIYLVLFIAGTVGFVASFHTALFSNLTVFFYRGLFLILFWGLIVAVIMYLLRRFRYKTLITVRDILLLFVVFCCVNTVIFTHLPVTADRSITVFMLGYMSDNGQESFTKNDIEDFFIDRYINDYDEFEKRLDEQLKTGTIEKTENGYRITDEGKSLMKLYESVADWFKLDDKLIHPSVNET